LDWQRLTTLVTIRPETRERLLQMGLRGAAAVGIGYLAASAVSAYFMSDLLGSALLAFNRVSARDVAVASVNLAVTENYRDIRKVIVDRNLFNSSGELPDESSPDSGDKPATNTFDINGPCNKPTVNVDLVGTIYMGETGSIATLQEQGYSESDVYKQGDLIVGNEKATIVKIERNRVILNNGGTKECLELATEKKGKANDGFPEVAASAPVNTGGGGMDSGGAPASTGDCNLDEKYVQDELGPGFGTIIQKARLVPNTTDNAMNGFKIFAIESGSLLAKVGLQNGDIITQVNDNSLKQPEQGFTLYQAFQDDREIRINILRRGTTPMTITCRIK
jgi:type II secretion system protein C